MRDHKHYVRGLPSLTQRIALARFSMLTLRFKVFVAT
jgi:hypothetical protein